MSKESYSSLAGYYDRLNAHVDYNAWAQFLIKLFKRYGVPEGGLVLDLACGTGNITLPLALHGYNMTGADISAEMLAEASKKSREANADILWLCQDMRSFELYGTVDAVICCLDSINYLTGRQGLKQCFSLVENYLNPAGLFVFDVNTPYKFKNVYGCNHYILEAENVYCGWKNDYDEKSGLCDFDLTLFVREGNGLYRRFEEKQRERCWSETTLRRLLNDSGIEVLDIVSDFEMTGHTGKDERWFFICRAKK